MTVRTASAPISCAAARSFSPRSWSGSSTTTTTSSSGWTSRQRRDDGLHGAVEVAHRSGVSLVGGAGGCTAADTVTRPMPRPVVWSLYAMLVLIWSSTWVAIKLGLDDMPPLLGAGIRFALAGVGLLVFARCERPFAADRPRARGRHRRPAVRVHLRRHLLGRSNTSLRPRGGPVRRAAHLRRADRVGRAARRAAAGAAVRRRRARARRAGVRVLGERRARRLAVRGRRPRSPALLAPLGPAIGNVATEAPRRGRRRARPERLGGGPRRRAAARRLGGVRGLGRAPPGRAGAVGSIAYLAAIGTALAFVTFDPAAAASCPR